MKVNKIVLCTLPKEGELYFFSTPPYFLNQAVSYPPLGLLYLAAQLTDKQVKLIDASAEKLTIEETIERIRKEKPDILGFTAYTIRVLPLKRICEKIKEEFKDSIRIVVGGNHTSIYPLETLQYKGVDYVLRGECDHTFRQLLQAIENGENEETLSRISGLYYYGKSRDVKSNAYKEPEFDLDDIPFPNRGLIDPKLYSTIAQDTSLMTTMVSSRGCPFKCIFCDVPNSKIRFRKPQNVVDEIGQITGQGISEICFFDDCFNLDRERVLQICNRIIKNRLKVKWSCRARVFPFDDEMAELMASAGCNRIHFGVESVNNDILKYCNKGITFEQSERALAICRKHKINTLIYLIFGFPGETPDDLKNAERIIIHKLKPNLIFPNILFPLPGSKFYYELLKKGVLKDDFWAKFVKNPEIAFDMPSIRAKGEDGTLIDFVNGLNRKFYFSPRFIFNNLGKIFKTNNLSRCISTGLSMLNQKRRGS